MSRVIASIVALGTLGAWVVLAGQSPDKAFKQFLSPADFLELTKRSHQRMGSTLDQKVVEAEQPIFWGYAMSQKGPKASGSIGKLNLKPIMNLLRTKAKGGEGIAADLQYSAKVKNQNGVEALINALAAKKLSDANATKLSRELELLADRVAVIGSLTLMKGPDKKKDEVKSWNEQATVMRDAAIELAEAAKKKDAAAIFEASKRLENTCVECHAVFK